MADGRTGARDVWGLELLSWWRYYNTLYLHGALRPPVLRIMAGTGRLGTWDRTGRTIGIAEDHITAHPWLAVMETLRHEMAHQYADEVLGALGEPPHGPAFRRACETLRVDPHQDRAGAGTADRDAGPPRGIVEKIQKLLSLSASPNEHEARVAVNKARELLLRHNIDAAEVAAERRFGVRWLGPVRGRHHHWETLLGSILNDFFFVSVIWTQSFDAVRQCRGTVLAVYGRSANLAMAEYVHGYLTRLLDELWRDYQRRKNLRGDRERLRYFAGVLGGFCSTLQAHDHALRAQHALVWKGDSALELHVRQQHPHVRTSSTAGTLRTPAYEDGLADGRAVTLRRPLGATRAGIGGYLTSGDSTGRK